MRDFAQRSAGAVRPRTARLGSLLRSALSLLPILISSKLALNYGLCKTKQTKPKTTESKCSELPARSPLHTLCACTHGVAMFLPAFPSGPKFLDGIREPAFCVGTAWSCSPGGGCWLQRCCALLYSKLTGGGLPWWCRGQLSPCATTTELALQSLRATTTEHVHHNY